MKMSSGGGDFCKKNVKLKDCLQMSGTGRITSPYDVSITSSRCFSEHTLVDDPRRIMFEKTTLETQSPLTKHLHRFYERVARVDDDVIEARMDDVRQLLTYLEPRVRKLLRTEGTIFQKFVPFGSAVERTVARHLSEVDVIMELSRDRAKVIAPAAGVKKIELKPYSDKAGAKPDPFRFGRSEDGRHLSPHKVVSCVCDVIKRSVRLYEDASLKRKTGEEDFNSVTLTLVTSEQMMNIDVNIYPAFRSTVDDSYLLPSKCAPDGKPSEHWRVCHVDREAAILRMMKEADRGMHCKAYVTMKALVQVEPTLEGLPVEHIRMALLHAFDSSVDSVPRWQRASLTDCFRRILSFLSHFYSNESLPDFFHNDRNLLTEVPPRLVSRLRTRLAYLVQHERELLRVLAKRTPKDGEGDTE